MDDDHAAEANPRTEIRILSYNVYSLRDDKAALARVIEACAPDIACIQEAPRFFGWRAAARRLAESAGMHVVCGGADASGNLLLRADRVAVDHCEALYLKHRRGLHLRGLAIAVVGVGPARLTVASTHMSLDAGQRLEQAPEILGHLDRVAAAHGAPSQVLAGDFNCQPGSPEWRIFSDRLLDSWVVAPEGEAYTCSAKDPHQRIDAVFGSPDIEIVGSGVPVGLASQADMAVATDHRPVLAVLRV